MPVAGIERLALDADTNPWGSQIARGGEQTARRVPLADMIVPNDPFRRAAPIARNTGRMRVGRDAMVAAPCLDPGRSDEHI